MGLMIRLRQQGNRNAKKYRLVLMPKDSPRDGKYIEKLGFYNPLSKDEDAVIEAARIDHWLSQGAMLSENAEALVRRKAPEIMKKYDEIKLLKLKKKKEQRKKKKAAAPKKEAAPKKATAKKTTAKKTVKKTNAKKTTAKKKTTEK